MTRYTTISVQRVNQTKRKSVKVVAGKAHAMRFDRVSASLLNKVIRRKNKNFTKAMNEAVKIAYLKEFGGKRELAA